MMAEDCNFYTLSEAVDRFLMLRGNLKRKYFDVWLVIGEEVWRDLFRNTLWTVRNVWVPIQKGKPYDFIRMPKDVSRYLGVFVKDDCGNLTPLYYDQKMSVIPRPEGNGCGSEKCDCSGLCGEINNFSVTTTPVVIGNTTYYEKTYLKYCSGGTIYRYREIPTKKYNEIATSGDYNLDQNPDYSRAGSFGNYTVVTYTTSDLVCTLKTKENGCPEDSQENEEEFINKCGCFVNSWCDRKYCDHFMDAVNYNERGQISFSEDGTKIFIKQDVRRVPPQLVTRGWVMLRYQTSGVTPGKEIIIPEYTKFAFWAGLMYRFMQFKDGYSINEKEDAKAKYTAETDAVILFLNPLNQETMSNTQDRPRLW